MDKKLLKQVELYIKEHYDQDLESWGCHTVNKEGATSLGGFLGGILSGSLKILGIPHYGGTTFPSKDLERLKQLLNETDEVTFVDLLMTKIDEQNLKDADVYKRAGQSRQQFSKMRSNRNYHVSKDVAISYALALQLNKDESIQLLNSAGYTFATKDIRDLVILFCIENEKLRNIDSVNQVCLELNCKPLCNIRY